MRPRIWAFRNCGSWPRSRCLNHEVGPVLPVLAAPGFSVLADLRQRRVTAPLAAVSAAAEPLGNDLNAPPMPETGTIETRQASRAFNTMQARLRSLIENRTRMLAAISHDLRTPLTLLRLRAENVEDRQERDKMLGTIAEMDSMVGETLQFARDEATTELSRRSSKASSMTWRMPACP